MKNIPNNVPDFWDELSEAQKKSIETSIKQLKKGKGIPHEEAMFQLRNFLEWKQLSIDGMRIKKALDDAGLDHDKLWTEARTKAWSEFKDNTLINIGLEQIENGQAMSYEEAKRRIKQWFAKKTKEEKNKKR